MEPSPQCQVETGASPWAVLVVPPAYASTHVASGHRKPRSHRAFGSGWDLQPAVGAWGLLDMAGAAPPLRHAALLTQDVEHRILPEHH